MEELLVMTVSILIIALFGVIIWLVRNLREETGSESRYFQKNITDDEFVDIFFSDWTEKDDRHEQDMRLGGRIIFSGIVLAAIYVLFIWATYRSGFLFIDEYLKWASFFTLKIQPYFPALNNYTTQYLFHGEGIEETRYMRHLITYPPLITIFFSAAGVFVSLLGKFRYYGFPPRHREVTTKVMHLYVWGSFILGTPLFLHASYFGYKISWDGFYRSDFQLNPITYVILASCLSVLALIFLLFTSMVIFGPYTKKSPNWKTVKDIDHDKRAGS